MSLRLRRFPWSPWRSTTNIVCDADLIRRRRYGIIEIREGRLARVMFRPWPTLISLPEVWWLGGGYHEHATGDCCRLYFNQPRSASNYLALMYAVSSGDARYATIRRAAQVLDEVARIKHSDAIVCEASNARISDRLLMRCGWERHLLDSPRRHWIKRFYGSYGPALVDGSPVDD